MFSTNIPVEWVPRPYQRKAVKLMLQQSAAALLLDPGMGKTTSTLAAFKILQEKGYVKRMLVIAPLRPAYNVWPDEMDKWENFCDLTCSILHGKDKDWEADNPDDVDIYIINPEGLKWLLNGRREKKRLKVDLSKIKKMGVDMLVIDESTKFKHSNTDRFKYLKKILNVFQRRYILTGTVSPNGLMDLFGQYYILDGGNALGSYITHYRSMYFNQPDPYNEHLYVPMPDALERITERISPLSLQLSAEDYLDMPDLHYVNIEVELPKNARSIYNEIENEFVSLLTDDTVLVAGNAAIAGTKCRQIANGAVYTSTDVWEPVHTAKLDALEDLVDELSGSPLLVLYEYRHDLERILERFPGTPFLGSGVSASRSNLAIKAFNKGELPLLLGHPASMGHGLNLQSSCNHLCWFGITWNFEYYDQAIARIYRQGQDKIVFAYHIVARDTLDEKVQRVLARKERTQEALFDALS